MAPNPPEPWSPPNPLLCDDVDGGGCGAIPPPGGPSGGGTGAGVHRCDAAPPAAAPPLPPIAAYVRCIDVQNCSRVTTSDPPAHALTISRTSDSGSFALHKNVTAASRGIAPRPDASSAAKWPEYF